MDISVNESQLAQIQNAVKAAAAPEPAATASQFSTSFGAYLRASQGEDTPENRETIRKTLSETLGHFAAENGYKARAGKDFNVEIVSRPGAPAGIMINDRTGRGKDLLRAWSEFQQRLELEGHLEQIWGAIRVLDNNLKVVAQALKNLQDGKPLIVPATPAAGGKIFLAGG